MESAATTQKLQQRPNDYVLIKLFNIGNAGVGKTRLQQRVCDRRFQDVYRPTIGADFKMRTYSHLGGKDIKLQYWDTAGQERFTTTMSRFYYRGAAICLLCYDVTDRKSFDAVFDTWRPQMEEEAPEDVLPVLVGLKADIPIEKWQVRRDQAAIIASQFRMRSFVVSSKEGDGVEEMMNTVLEASRSCIFGGFRCSYPPSHKGGSSEVQLPCAADFPKNLSEMGPRCILM